MPSASDIFLIVLSLLVFLSDTLILLFPSLANDEKRKDRSLMNRLYGPLLGIKHGAVFDGIFVSLLLIPIIVLAAVHTRIAQLIVVLCVFLWSPFLALIGIYMTMTGLLEKYEPLAFGLLSLLFGLLGGTMRMKDDQLFDADRFTTFAVALHVVWSVVVALYAVRMKRTLPKLKAVLQLEMKKIDVLSNGWPVGEDRPVGCVVETELESLAEKQLASAAYDPYWKHALWTSVMIGVALLLSWLLGSTNANSTEIVNYISVPLVGVWAIVEFVVTVVCANGGLGRTELKDPMLMVGSGVSPSYV